MPKKAKNKQEVDVTRFDPLVEEALRAFGADVTYAVEMSKQAVTVERKRATWKVRAAAKKAEEEARTECDKHEFVCEVKNPCGTGDCRFADPEFSGVYQIGTGKTERPRNSTQDPYAIESVVKYVIQQQVKKPRHLSEEDDER